MLRLFWFDDPGDCEICGAKHCSCVGPNPPMQIVQLPNRDALTVPTGQVADAIQKTLGPNEFTTGTYRRKGRRAR